MAARSWRVGTARSKDCILSGARYPARASAGLPARIIPFASLMLMAAVGVLAGAAARAQGADDWRVVVLGIAQDGGLPQLACDRPLCRDAREGRRRIEKVASLGLVNRQTRRAYIFDATPDF